jgi:hypothetical protein
MLGITSEQKERLWERLQAYDGQPLTEKEQETLVGLLHSEPMVKALSQLLRSTNDLPGEYFTQFNLADPLGVAQAIKLQGVITGNIQAIEALFSLITLPEEKQDDEPESD